MRIDDKVHTAAPAAIAAVGTTEGDIFLATKRHHAVTAITRFDFDSRPIE
jgi:hypothetical protein